MLVTSLLLAFDLAAVVVAVVYAIKHPDAEWQITPSLVVMTLSTIGLGLLVDSRAFVLTAGIVATFGAGRLVHDVRQHRVNR